MDLLGILLILHFFFAHFSVALSAASDEDLHDPLTYEEINAIACSAGYVLHALKKKLLKVKSPCPLTKDMLLCLDYMISSDNEINGSRDWIELVNRGVLTCVNSITYAVFLAMEWELRTHLQIPFHENFIQQATSAIKGNEDLWVFWSMLSAGWNEISATNVLDRVVSLWITMLGLSYASAWIEKYKTEQKKATQKSNGLRKQL